MASEVPGRDPYTGAEVMGMSRAEIATGFIVLDAVHEVEGDVVAETACIDYDHYARLPAVVRYPGRRGPVLLGKTGWSSDTNRACYKSGAQIAEPVR